MDESVYGALKARIRDGSPVGFGEKKLAKPDCCLVSAGAADDQSPLDDRVRVLVRRISLLPG